MFRVSQPSLDEYVEENSELLSRILACGNNEARAYVLALLANCENTSSVEKVQPLLDQIKQNQD